jgi:2-methylisoborneol synthase
MSTLSRMLRAEVPGELSDLVMAVLTNLDPAAPQNLGDTPAADPPAPANPPDLPSPERFAFGPTGLGTAAARAFVAPDGDGTSPEGAVRALSRNRLGGRDVTALVVVVEEPPGDDSVPALFCPGAVRDDPALGEQVNEELIEWAEQVGIYPGRLDRLRATNFGRLMMLTHPATDDPDRLLAAAKCVLAEWATDDHFLDEEAMGADADLIGSRLGIAYAAVDPADLPTGYAAQLDQALSDEPVTVAYRTAFDHLARYASPTQVARLHHELAVMFMAYNHEATWRRTGRTPPVWEYLTHRHENSFLPPMVLVDPVAGYEVPAFEFADRRVRRVFSLAGTASVILNDLYSMATESDTDFDLPKLIAHEEGCSQHEAIRRTVLIHNELMHTFVAEATVLAGAGTLALRRFLTDIWAWLGGSREWHSTTARYAVASGA